MSFSFGFTGDSDDEYTSVADPAPKQEDNFINSLDCVPSNVYPAKEVDLKEALNSLKSTRVTFETYVTPEGNAVFRRELFDVKHQVMMEDDNSTDAEVTDEHKILIGTNATDLVKNVYEGGLKSWECSVDTVDYLCSMQDETLFKDRIVELGCGTALPSTYLFNRALRSNHNNLGFVLADYNESVLRLVTLPNLIVTWASTLEPEQLIKLQRSEDETIPIVPDELQLTQKLLDQFYSTLQEKAISIRLISGAWSRSFLELVNSDNHQTGLVITSETIYSRETLPVISELVIEFVSNAKALGIVAAKDIYFGVGGSLVEFENYLTKRQLQGMPIQFVVNKVNAGLKRSIVLVTNN